MLSELEIMNEQTHTAKIVLEIEWIYDPADINDPAQWDWKRIKSSLNLKNVKFLGTFNQGLPEKASNWIDN
jgi:hypothetical protein